MSALPLINWMHLAQALAFYEQQGFTRLELDWHTTKEINLWTCPHPDRMYGFDDRALVGSAEQSFMQAQVDGLLQKGKSYVALTPCFRREPVVSQTHQLHFMKVELYVAHEASDQHVRRLSALAKQCMESLAPIQVDCVETIEGLDLDIQALEVGSYAARRMHNHEWTCGTGLAEPRFSTACQRVNQTR